MLFQELCTLQDRISGRVIHGKKSGTTPYLNQEEEKDFVDFLEVASSVGYGKTRKQIKALVESTACDKGTLQKERISDGWFRRFLGSHNLHYVKVTVQLLSVWMQ